MSSELTRMSAVEAVARLKAREISPLELIEASARRIAEVEPAVNALPTLCLDRARDHARRIMQGGAACEASGEAGWLAGLPVSIKDLTDVAGVRTTYGSPLFADHVPAQVAPAGRAHRAQGRHRDGQVEHAGIRRRRQHLQRGVRPHAQSLEHLADLAAARPAAARCRWRPARSGWRTASDHGGSLRRPGSHCSVVGLRPSPGRVTRGTSSNLWSPLSVQGPMARSVADLALFLDTMAGFCPHDPMTFDAPAVSFSDGLAQPVAPKRVAFTADYNGRMPIDREVREICTKDGAALRGAGLHRRGSVARYRRGRRGIPSSCAASTSSSTASCRLQEHRDKLKPDIIWNTERGLKQTPSDLARADRERAAFYRRMVEFFGPTICW